MHVFVVFIIVVLASISKQVASLNLALHAQGRYVEHGWVAGSEVTTRGLKAAFEVLTDSKSGSRIVENVQVFAPFSYAGLHDTKWDVAIIEGFAESVPRFIYAIRKSNPHALVFHYCLDTYPKLERIFRLDVDGVFTNSESLKVRLNRELAPTQVVLLAADPNVMRPMAKVEKYAHQVVYLGQYSLSKKNLTEMLLEVQDLGLAIYGSAWDKHSWRGILPLHDIPELYSSAKVVLGTTESKQRDMGMVNNRVFEALSCGAAFVGDNFREQRDLFQDTMLYTQHPGDTRKHVETLLNNATLRQQLGNNGRQLIRTKHTYGNRAETMIRFIQQLQQKTQTIESYVRPNLPRALIVFDHLDNEYKSDLMKQFAIQFRVALATFQQMKWEELLSFDVVVFVAECGSKFEQLARGHMSSMLSNSALATALFVKESQLTTLRKCICQKDSFQYDLLSMFSLNKNKCDGQEPKLFKYLTGELNDDVSICDNIYTRYTCGKIEDLQLGHNLLQSRFDSIRAGANIEILYPTNGEIICSEDDLLSDSIIVHVNINQFSLPEDGMWCIQVNDNETGCVGDTGITTIQIAVNQITRHDEGISIRAILRSHMTRSLVRVSEKITVYVGTTTTTPACRVQVNRVQPTVCDTGTCNRLSQLSHNSMVKENDHSTAFQLVIQGNHWPTIGVPILNIQPRGFQYVGPKTTQYSFAGMYDDEDTSSLLFYINMADFIGESPSRFLWCANLEWVYDTAIKRNSRQLSVENEMSTHSTIGDRCSIPVSFVPPRILSKVESVAIGCTATKHVHMWLYDKICDRLQDDYPNTQTHGYDTQLEYVMGHGLKLFQSNSLVSIDWIGGYEVMEESRELDVFHTLWTRLKVGGTLIISDRNTQVNFDFEKQNERQASVGSSLRYVSPRLLVEKLIHVGFLVLSEDWSTELEYFSIQVMKPW